MSGYTGSYLLKNVSVTPSLPQWGRQPKGSIPLTPKRYKTRKINNGILSSFYNPSTSLNYPTPYGTKPLCPQTYGFAHQSGADTGLFSPQGPVVNTKMEPCCPPRKLSPRFVAKIQNRSNCGALYFPFSGILEGVFFGRTLYCLVPDRVPGGHYGPESGLGVCRKIWGY